MINYPIYSAGIQDLKNVIKPKWKGFCQVTVALNSDRATTRIYLHQQ